MLNKRKHLFKKNYGFRVQRLHPLKDVNIKVSVFEGCKGQTEHS